MAKKPRIPVSILAILVGVTAALIIANAMAQQGPRTRAHNVTQSDGVEVNAANSGTPGTSHYEEHVEGNRRIIEANGLPDHTVGSFPNRDNPNRIRAQSYHFEVDATPQQTGRVTWARGIRFGVAVNGVAFDPFAGEFYRGERSIEWQYEALSGAVDLGVDANYAHVQPDGNYHYHGVPVALLNRLGVTRGQHSPLVGWAADGFPIFAFYGALNPEDPASPIIEHTSGYRLKDGRRPGGSGPAGYYDGTFVGDYEYVAGSGTLDECNGAWTISADFPNGTYAYFITKDWPVVPRCFKGEPSSDFRHTHNGMANAPGGGMGDRRGPGGAGGFGGPGDFRRPPPPGAGPRW